MFGDTGHGIILTLFGAYMVIYEAKLLKKKTNNEIWNIFFSGRYIILLMGFFSMYTGIVYNDVFSKSMNIFGSEWHANYNSSTIQDNKLLQLDPKNLYSGKPYPIGLDPIWQVITTNTCF